ncbi:F-box/FBD/LRR-repeat protein At3g26920 [Cannabis sativa]|uniref:F-box/FBD/LRR-repeat protein At3g26920 n=1 Tax=Cannabis sativa TaxID=3483 RepID=UPI0029CA8128|nr:F-box/FBD/LRR-repeat protein At3g26920 [Cannabis sativa]
MGEDRISKLPDGVIIHMLSFLPTKDVVRTCLLSKRWKLIWYSVPTLFFSNVTSPDLTWCWDIEMFYNFVDNCLEHLKKGFVVDSIITSFKLKMFDCYHRSKAGLLDKWLAFVVESKVREIHLRLNLDMDLENFDEYYYCLPKILQSATYLTVLELNCVELDTSCSFSFPCLKTLSLEDVRNLETAEDDGVVKFLLGCSSLEKLLLLDYVFLVTDHDVQFRLHSLSLKFMELKRTYDYYKLNIQVEAVNLESLVLHGVILDEMNLSSCKKIRNLSLVDCPENLRPSIQALISDVPLLESLTLSKCDADLDHLKITSQYLKSFNFKYSDMINVVTIESALDLDYFSYEGYINCRISIDSFNLLNGKIVIFEQQENYDTNWFTNMMKFLSNLNCSWNIVSLHVRKDKALILPENFKTICPSPLLNWKHLRVVISEYRKPYMKVLDLKDSLMWMSSSLETLSINGKDVF